MLSQLTDPYEVAIVAHALTLTNSPAKEGAFGKLHGMKRETGNLLTSILKRIESSKTLKNHRWNGLLEPQTSANQ